jgi:hypothetical protein
VAEESQRSRVFFQAIVPISAAVIGGLVGAIATTWVQAGNSDAAQMDTVVALLKDVSLTSQQKLQALETYKEISDRPWAIIRSLTSSLTSAVAIAIGAMIAGGVFFRRN